MLRLIAVSSLILAVGSPALAQGRHVPPISKGLREETRIRLASRLNQMLGLEYSRNAIEAKDLRVRYGRPTSPWSSASLRFSVRNHGLRGTGSLSAVAGDVPVIFEVTGSRR